MRNLPPPQAPYAYGGRGNPVYTDSSIHGMVQTQAVAPDYQPRGFNAQSPDQKQFSPAYLYDWQLYPAAGQASFTFFGSSSGNNGKTDQDTNMPQPNNVGSGNVFIVQEIFIGLQLGVAYATTGTDAAVVLANPLRDFAAVMNNGVMQFFVNKVPQLGYGISPLLLAALPSQISCGGAIATGNAVADQALAPFAINSGYNCVEVPFALTDQTPFSGAVTFPRALAPLPSTNATTYIGMLLKGINYRPAG